MNITKDEALKMAIDLLGEFETQYGKDDLLLPFGYYEIINACKEALESQEIGNAEIRQMLIDIEYYQKRVEELESQKQEYDINEMIDKITPENLQEPVAWMDENNYVFEKSSDIDDSGEKTPLYTHPAQPLNDDEICKIYEDIRWDIRGTDIVIDFARAIEQAHNIGVKDDTLEG